MRRSLAVFAVTTALLAAPAGRPVLLDRIWSVLSAIWNGPSTDAGCGADPYGLCAPAAQPTADVGCGFDPFGRCTSAAQPAADAGCGMDPYGLCTPAAQPAADAGCGMDPFGCPKGS